jgi:uncharacterized membrane protein
MKKQITIIFLFILVSLSFAKDYSIPSATVTYILNPDGTISVEERITYELSGSFHQLYIQKPPELPISNLSGYCEDANCTFSTTMYKGWRELRLDGSFNDQTITAVFKYTILGEILEQKDCAQFFYKLWGDRWEKPVEKLTAIVIFPNDSSQVEYFIHPVSDNIQAIQSNNTITIVSYSHPSYTYLEINSVMPKEWFSTLRMATEYMTKDEIIEGEKAYIEEMKNISSKNSDTSDYYSSSEYYSSSDEDYSFLALLFILIIPSTYIYFYFAYGREIDVPELKSLPPYEREPPENLPPALMANMIYPTLPAEAIGAELLFLAHNKYLEMEECEVEYSKWSNEKEKSLRFRRNYEKSVEGLLKYQKTLLSFVELNKRDDGWFYISDIDKGYIPMDYSKFYTSFVKQCDEELKERSYLDTTGYEKFNSFLSAMTIIIYILMILSPYLIIFTAIAMIELLLYYFIISGPDKFILSRWSKEGRMLERRIHNYKKFIEDLTLMKEKEIMDVVLWENILIYATALGIAEKVKKAMKMYVPQKEISGTQLSLYLSYNSRVVDSFRVTTRQVHSSSIGFSSGGIGGGISRGGFGRGFGGGGGGGGAR